MKNKRILIIGLGISGRSAANFLLEQGANVFGVDGNQKHLNENEELINLRRNGLITAHESAALDLNLFDLVVVSPGISPNHPLFESAKNLGKEIIGEVELACRYTPFKHVLGITGTNGKTTVTLLVTHILNHAGKKARALGNVGKALTSSTPDLEEIVVVELSSYQLETMNLLDVGCHLKYHSRPFLSYMKVWITTLLAKMRISQCLKPEGTLYLESLTYEKYHPLLPPCKHQTYGYNSTSHFSTNLNQISGGKYPPQALPSSLIGKVSHDLENLMAEDALCLHAGVTPTQFFDGYKTFSKPSRSN